MLAGQRPRVLIASLLLALFAFAWLWLQAYQSHYVSGLRVLGDQDTVALVGQSTDGRGDEWSTYLPLLNQYLRERFPARSRLPPYRDLLHLLFPLPPLQHLP